MTTPRLPVHRSRLPLIAAAVVVALVLIGAAVAGVLLASGDDGPATAAAPTSPAASSSPAAPVADVVTCAEFQAAAVSGALIDGLQPIGWTTRILEERLAADGHATPARVGATSGFFSQVLTACVYPDQPADAVAQTVYAASPASFT